MDLTDKRLPAAKSRTGADDDFSVIVTVCRGPGALGIYSTHGTPSFMHHYGFKKGIRAESCPYPTPILH